MTEISSSIEKAKSLLIAGELVAIPTETVYGLAANAFDENAVKKIFELKKRPAFNPLIVHIQSIDYLNEIAKNVPPIAWKLAEEFWPGPLTLLLEKKEIIPDCVTAGNPTVAVRMPKHQLTLDLLSQIPFPVAAPSANPFMSISPTKPEHVKKYFEGKLKYILDGGNCEDGIESTIIGFKEGKTILYRQGSCDIFEIEKITGLLFLAEKETKTLVASGMLKRHYAPKTPFFLAANYLKEVKKHQGKKVGLMLFSPINQMSENIVYRFLSENDSLKEAAANLYSTLIDLDAMNLDIIISTYVPNKGIGISINDRLERAASI